MAPLTLPPRKSVTLSVKTAKPVVEEKPKNENPVWNTKYGSRRVRFDPPSIAEAIAAAQGLSDDPEDQAGIAASLLGADIEMMRGEVARAGRRKASEGIAFAGREGASRAVVVERRTVRRPMSVRTNSRSGY